MLRRLGLLPALLATLAACGAYDVLGPRGVVSEDDAPTDAGRSLADGGPADAGSADAGSDDAGSIDAEPIDAGPDDAGSGPIDAGPDDARPIDAGSREPCDPGMILIDGATFTMGRADGETDEGPAHEVTLSAYCIDRFEVTVDAYAAHRTLPTAADRAPGLSPLQQEVWDASCNGRYADRSDSPVNCVDAQDGEFYCRARGARLPTEAEWEYAARGRSDDLYPWGNEPPGPWHANLCGTECFTSDALPIVVNAAYPSADAWPQTAPIGAVEDDESPFGVRDLGGNVMEWVSDLYNAYPPGPVTNPRQTAGQGVGWVMRGASWLNSAPHRLTVYARWSSVSMRRPDFGFRCAMTARPR